MSQLNVGEKLVGQMIQGDIFKMSQPLYATPIGVKTLVEKYKASPEWLSLQPNSKRTYETYLLALVECSTVTEQVFGMSPHFIENAMQLPVAVASDVAYWGAIIRSFKGAHAQAMARRVFLNVTGWGRKYGFCSFDYTKYLPQPTITRQDKLPLQKEEAVKLGALLCSPQYPNRFKPYLASALFAFHTGMRPSEVASLMWKDVGEEFILVRSAKAKQVGVVSRMVRITAGVRSSLFTCSRFHANVFLSVEGKPLNKDTRCEAFHVACKMVGIPEREYYSTRRGTATEMHKAGYHVNQIKDQLGHSDISTTMIYIKPTMLEAASQFKGF